MDDADRTPEVPDTPDAEEQAPTADEQQGSTPPWGEDFDAERAWSTIQTQRQAEKDLKARVGEYEQLLADPDALLSRLGYEVAADEEPQAPGGYEEQQEYDPVAEMRGELDQLQGTIAQQQAQEIQREMGEHIDTLLTESDLKLTRKQRDAIAAEAWNGGEPSPAHTAQVVKDWADDLAAYRDEAVSGYRKSKRAPRAAPSGQPGSKQIDFSNDEERQRMFAELMAAEGDQ